MNNINKDIITSIIKILYIESTDIFEEESIKYLDNIKKLMLICKHWYKTMYKYYFRDINNISEIGFFNAVDIKHQKVFTYVRDLVSSGKAYISGSRALAFFNRRFTPNDIDFYVPHIYKDSILKLAKPNKMLAFIGHLSVTHLLKYSKIDILIINNRCTIKDAINIFDLDCVKCYLTKNRVMSLVPQIDDCTIVRTMCKTTPYRIKKYKKRGYKTILYSLSVNRCNFEYLKDNWQLITRDTDLRGLPKFKTIYYDIKLLENMDDNDDFFINFIRQYAKYLYRSRRYVLSSILIKIFSLVFYGEG